jgi:hypothetical protein
MGRPEVTGFVFIRDCVLCGCSFVGRRRAMGRFPVQSYQMYKGSIFSFLILNLNGPVDLSCDS